jgi:hypothetical protein
MGRGIAAGSGNFAEVPEPDEELPDSDLSDGERQAAIQREKWRRESHQ